MEICGIEERLPMSTKHHGGLTAPGMWRAARAFVAACLALCAGLATAQPALTDAERGRIDAIFKPHDHDSPGYAVGVVKNGVLVFARGYGRAELDNNIPIGPHTAFHLASLSKQFTAAAVALLVLDGKLSLDTPVAQFFPQAQKFGPALQVKHLIYFTSGLPDYTTQERPNHDPWFAFHYFTIDDAIAASLAAPALKFAPGTRWDYSNINYMLLARIVEQISGMPLSAFLQQRVFKPLGMSDSLLDDDATAPIPRRATGYADRANEQVRQQLKSVGVDVRPGTGWLRLPRVSPHYGGSGVFSSIEDLAKWDHNFDQPQLQGPAFTALMLRREKFEHDKSNDAFGLVHGEHHGRPMIWFSGGDLDSSTYMARLPDDHLTVICLSNNPLGDAQGKAQQVLEILLPGAR